MGVLDLPNEEDINSICEFGLLKPFGWYMNLGEKLFQSDNSKTIWFTDDREERYGMLIVNKMINLSFNSESNENVKESVVDYLDFFKELSKYDIGVSRAPQFTYGDTNFSINTLILNKDTLNDFKFSSIYIIHDIKFHFDGVITLRVILKN